LGSPCRFGLLSEKGDGLRSRRDPAETDLAAPDASAATTERLQTRFREDAQIPFPRAAFDVGGADLPLHALDAAPSRYDRFDPGDELNGLVRLHRRVATGFPKAVQRGPWD